MLFRISYFVHDIKDPAGKPSVVKRQVSLPDTAYVWSTKDMWVEYYDALRSNIWMNNSVARYTLFFTMYTETFRYQDIGMFYPHFWLKMENALS
jgi:hypothetical protein